MAERPGAEDGVEVRLLARMRLVLVITASGVQWGLSLRQLLHDLHRSSPAWPEVAAFGALTATALVTAGGVVVTRTPPRWVDAVLAATCLAAGAVAFAVSPPERLVTADDWVFGLVGWFGLMLLVHRSLAANAAFLLAHLCLTVGVVVVHGGAGDHRLLPVSTAVLPVFGLQLLVAFVLRTTRRTVADVQAAAEQEEAALSRERIASQLREDGRARVATLRAGTIPLLTRLANGTADPADPEVRRRAGFEAARLRRMLAEQDDVSDQLLNGLHAGIDAIERQGRSVVLSVRGAAVAVPPDVRHQLVDATLAGLSWVGSTARLTVLRTAGTVRLCVTGDLRPGSTPAHDSPGPVGVVLVQEGGMLVWEARWDRS